MSAGPRLVVVGDASIDYFVQVPHIAGNDNKAIGSLSGVYGGGMSANLAAAAARHGIAVDLITKTGAGPDTDAALAELNRLGVSSSIRCATSSIRPGCVSSSSTRAARRR